MTTLPVGQRFNLTGWQGGTSGFRIDLESRSRVFEPLQNTLRHVQVVLPGRETPTHCRITPTFWTTCPEFRSDEIGRWMVRRGEKPWEKGRPPRYEAELVVVDDGTTGICIVQDVGSNRKSRLTGP